MVSTNKTKAILSISHTCYLKAVGGLEKFIFDQSNICNDNGYTFISVFPITKQLIIKEHTIRSRFVTWGIHIDKEKELSLSTLELIYLLRSYDIHSIYIHSIIFSPVNEIINIITNTATKNVFFYVHDYRSMCYCHVLMKNNKVYCGAGGPHLKKCIGCRFYPRSFYSNAIYMNLFTKIPYIQFIFPSKVSEEIWSSMYRNIEKRRKHIIPHQKFDENRIQYCHTANRLRLAYIGYKAFNKGWGTFIRLATEIQNRQLPIDLYILGKTDEEIEGIKHVEVSFQKDGTDAMINAIKSNKIDIAFLWSPWPETYSYTFFESYVGGAIIITNTNSGNIAAQTRDLKCGLVYENEEALISHIDEIEAYVRNYNVTRPSSLIPNKDFMFI